MQQHRFFYALDLRRCSTSIKLKYALCLLYSNKISANFNMPFTRSSTNQYYIWANLLLKKGQTANSSLT